MARSSFSENPLLRVSRPVSACSRCRSAKVKCDGKLPACTACEKAGRVNECSAANDQFARGKERSYVAALELRVEKLERRLAYARSRKASVAMHVHEAPLHGELDRKNSLAVIRATIHRNAARKRENSDINSLVSDFGYLSVNATTRDFEPSATNMTFARLVLAASVNDPLPDCAHTDDMEAPPRQTTYAIVQYYMANVYVFLPAFSETTILSLLNDVYCEHPQPLQSSDAWLLWMVLAIGSMAQSQSCGDDPYSDSLRFVSRALAHADRALMPGDVKQIQCLFLLTQFSMLDPTHFDSWSLIGFACRAVEDLGLHQELPRANLDEAMLEAQRRLFYCVYTLDRAISMVHARAFSFADDAVSVGLPAPTRYGDGPITGPTPASAALPLFQLRQRQSFWYQELFQTDPADPLPDPTSFVWQQCHEMRAWAARLPANLPPFIRDMLELELRYSYVYCVAPSARAPHLTPHGRLLIFEHVIAYVDGLHDICHAPSNVAFYTYHDALRTYFMGSQFVAVLRDAADVLLHENYPFPPRPMVEMPLQRGAVPPPPLPECFDHGAGGDNLQRSLRCLERVRAVLTHYGRRWEDALALLANFDVISTEVARSLEARRAEQEAQPQQAGPPPLPVSSMLPPQLLPQQSPFSSHPSPHIPSPPSTRKRHKQSARAPSREVRWVDVDVAQVVRR